MLTLDHMLMRLILPVALCREGSSFYRYVGEDAWRSYLYNSTKMMMFMATK